MSVNTKNLIKLRDYLVIHKEEISKHFNMISYRRNEDGIPVDYIDGSNCGTIGCVLGWAPFVEGLEPDEDEFRHYDNKESALDFKKYSYNKFGHDIKNGIWSFLFSPQWRWENNTVEGAIDRLNFVITALLENKELKMHEVDYILPEIPVGTTFQKWRENGK